MSRLTGGLVVLAFLLSSGISLANQKLIQQVDHSYSDLDACTRSHDLLLKQWSRAAFLSKEFQEHVDQTYKRCVAAQDSHRGALKELRAEVLRRESGLRRLPRQLKLVSWEEMLLETATTTEAKRCLEARLHCLREEDCWRRAENQCDNKRLQYIIQMRMRDRFRYQVLFLRWQAAKLKRTKIAPAAVEDIPLDVDDHWMKSAYSTLSSEKHDSLLAPFTQRPTDTPEKWRLGDRSIEHIGDCTLSSWEDREEKKTTYFDRLNCTVVNRSRSKRYVRCRALVYSPKLAPLLSARADVVVVPAKGSAILSVNIYGLERTKIGSIELSCYPF